MYLRRTSKLRTEISFDEPLNTDFDGNELLLSDVLGLSAETVYGALEGEADALLTLWVPRAEAVAAAVTSHIRKEH